jgi:hypothetical protein
MVPGKRTEFRDRLLDLYILLLTLLPLNIAWALLSLPLFTVFPALLGLVYATNRLAHDQPVTWRTVLDGSRRYFWVAWRWGITVCAVYALLIFSAWFYARTMTGWTPIVQGILVALTILWTILQLHALPLLMEQETPTVRLALRNSLVLVITATGRSGRLLFLSLLVVTGTAMLLPLATLFFSASFLAYLANRETALAIVEAGGRQSATHP